MADTPRRRYSRSPSPRRRYVRSRSRSRSASQSRSLSRSRSPVRRDISSRNDVINPGNNLYVTGLSARVVESDLEELFSQEGKVVDCRIVVDPRSRESRGFGFVTMDTLENADRCVKYLNRSTLEGRIITVEKLYRAANAEIMERMLSISNTTLRMIVVNGQSESEQGHQHLVLTLVYGLLLGHGPMEDTETTTAHAGHLSIHHIVEVENVIMIEIVPLITQVLVIAGQGQGLQNTHPIDDSVP